MFYENRFFKGEFLMKLTALLLNIFFIAINCLSASAEVQFYAMGDGPYKEKDFYFIYNDLITLSKTPDFLIHLGDIIPPHSKCEEDQYKKAKHLFKYSPKPFLFIQGGNEINDCPDSSQGLRLWEKHFLNSKDFRYEEFNISRQEKRRENFSFSRDDVVFVGINMINEPSSHKEWEIMHRYNIDWIKRKLFPSGKSLRAAVVFSHDFPAMSKSDALYSSCSGIQDPLYQKKEYSVFSKNLVELSRKFGKPILFLHGSEHCWHKDNPFNKARNVTRVIVDRAGKTPIIQVTIDDSPHPDPFRIDRRFKRRINWFEGKAKQGDPLAEFLLGKTILQYTRNYAEGVKWLAKSASSGFLPAIAELGEIEFNEGVLKKNYQAVRKTLLKVGKMAENYSCKRKTDLTNPFSFPGKAVCEMEILALQLGLFRLGWIYSKGLGVSQDFDKGKNWYMKAVNFGHGTSAYNLGVFYEEGHGVTKSYKEALKWYKKSADKGHLMGMVKVGEYLSIGRGIKKNNKEAILYFRRSAARGLGVSQYNVGIDLYFGIVSPQNRQLGIKWIKEAAKNNIAEAKKFLSNLKIGKVTK